MADAAQPSLTSAIDGHDDSHPVRRNHDCEEGDDGAKDANEHGRHFDLPSVYVLQTRHVLAAVEGEMACARASLCLNT